MSGPGRPPEATNGSFADVEREGSGPVVGQLRSEPMGWYGPVPANRLGGNCALGGRKCPPQPIRHHPHRPSAPDAAQPTPREPAREIFRL